MQAMKWLFIMVALLALAAGIWFGVQFDRSYEPQILRLYPQARPLAPFELRDQSDQPFTDADFKGYWSFVFFGFTYCPDVCPTTMALFDRMAKQMPESLRADTRFVLVSVDPERDTPAKLADYVGWFNSDFIGVTGEREALNELTRQLGVVYMKVPLPGSSDGYTVDHTAKIFLINPRGERFALFDTVSDPDSPAFNMAELLRDYEAVRD